MRVQVEGAELHVEVAGDGPPLLDISGSGSALNVLTAPSASPLTAAFTVAGYDHRGLGRSTSVDRALTMADFAADALAVADALGWSDFALVGTSFGGMVAQHVAVEQPERITRLVLCCTSSGGAGGSSYPLHTRPALADLMDLIDTRPDEAAALAALIQGREVPREPAFERQLQARAGHDVWDLLPNLTAPTLVASGRHDGVAPAANGEAIASRIPGARLEVFDGGHAFLWQDPRAWPMILDFLTQS